MSKHTALLPALACVARSLALTVSRNELAPPTPFVCLFPPRVLPAFLVLILDPSLLESASSLTTREPFGGMMMCRDQQYSVKTCNVYCSRPMCNDVTCPDDANVETTQALSTRSGTKRRITVNSLIVAHVDTPNPSEPK